MFFIWSASLRVNLFLVSQSWLSVIWRFGKLWFSFGKQVFDSICFGSVKVGFCLFGVLASQFLLVVAKVKVVCKNVCQVGGGIFF